MGVATLCMAYLPTWCKYLKISYTLPLVLLGLLMFAIDVPLPWPDPIWPLEWSKIFSELIVIVSLMAAGLKIGLRYSFQDWKNPLRLIGVTMPLCMIAIFLISYYVLQFNIAVSILLGAVLAPTDPVLASELQLKDKKPEGEKNTGLRYVLTAEAGLNDGLAFPFVFLAILFSKNKETGVDVWHWVNYYVGYKILAGVVIGGIIGYLYSLSLSKFSKSSRSDILNGFIAVSLTFTSYGIAELLDSYGFIAVFCTGLLANYHRDRKAHEHPDNEMILFVEETEKFFLVLWILFFGGSLASGILTLTDSYGIAFSLSFVLLIRPVFGMLALIGTAYGTRKKLAISFFGIRGIGSVFYLSYAFMKGNFENSNQLYGIVSYVILFSIIIHGLTSQRTIEYFKDTSG